ncbi:unnamed protein product [Paramecium sonneborni]|uniref:CRC domain-containing protein n=1 Tax=Paramecium sonneborni TaxID=65129 RepID=A0A8S1JS60_9CILI|nr:unnamed protein product [Paramecium sonneborni]
MNPLMRYYSESDCEAIDNSNCLSFSGIIDENSQQNRPQQIDDQFEQISLPNSVLYSTQCSSLGEKKKKSDIGDIQDDLKCSEIDNSDSEYFQPQIKCQCSKSQCQQSYCECFARGQTCSKHCGCQNCQNQQMNKKLQKIKKRLIKQKRNKQRTPRYLKGCTCGKSQCQNNFCSCHQDGKYCNSGCKCINCKNIYNFSLKLFQSIESVQSELNQSKNIVQFIIGYENSEKFQMFNTYLKQQNI